jgi:hypothetical protein
MPAGSAGVGVHPLEEPGAGVGPERIRGAGRDAQGRGRLLTGQPGLRFARFGVIDRSSREATSALGAFCTFVLTDP